MNTKYDSFKTAFIVRHANGKEMGRVWFEPETEWNSYVVMTDEICDFHDDMEDAIHHITRYYE